MSKLKIPKILQIKGVHPQDCITIGSIFDNDRLLITAEVKEDSVPSIFQDKDTWVRFSSLKCVNCTLTFDSIPIPCPITMQRKKNNDVMFTCKKNKNNKVIVFCSFECLINHVFDTISNDSTRTLILKMVEYMAVAFGVHPKSIKRGLGREDIDAYGGLYTVKKFKNQLVPIYW